MREYQIVSDLQARLVSMIREIPLARVPIFCASCAERFANGYVAWSQKESTTLPAPELFRQAIDLCWSEQAEKSHVNELSRQFRDAAPHNGQPLFSSTLSVYVVDISLVQQALFSRLEPSTNQGLLCSEYALDFYLQLMDLRREMAGVGPDYADPGRDVREFERDPEALTEAEHQLADAAALLSENFDLNALRESSAAHGRRVLDDVLKLVEGTQ